MIDESPTSPEAKAPPLFTLGKKLIFIGGLLIWGGFFLPWFSNVTVVGPSFAEATKALDMPPPSVLLQNIAKPGGAEMPFYLGWLVLGMAFLTIILPESFPELCRTRAKVISLLALVIGAATLGYLFLSTTHTAIKPGLLCNLAGYLLLLVGVLTDSTPSPANEV